MLPLLFALLLEAPIPAAPLRLTSTAFGQPVTIEVRDLPEPAAREAIQQALSEVSEVERLASDGSHGPLGRDLYTAWGLRPAPGTTPGTEPPPLERIEQTAELTACGRLTLDPQGGTAALAAGSGLELMGFAEGAAVDRAVEILRRRKAGNGFVRLGAVQRGFGPGPAGRGWPVALPPVAGLEEPPAELYLRDGSLAIASQSDHPLQGAGGASYLVQRTGKPARGVVMTAAVTELAMDAQGLATTMLINGPREGQLRLGSLIPKPSVLWFVGSGTGPPLVVGYRWSEVARPRK
jgi:thiamine biosynthesis lipoprotein ApbE